MHVQIEQQSSINDIDIDIIGIKYRIYNQDQKKILQQLYTYEIIKLYNVLNSKDNQSSDDSMN